MKFIIDNNLSPLLAHALDKLAQPDGHKIIALRDRFEPSTSDIEWITAIASERNWVIISQDQFSKKDGLEKEVIKRSGLTIFCLKKGWSNQKYWDKAHHLVRWFPKIAAQAEAVTGGAAFQVPLVGKKFEQIL